MKIGELAQRAQCPVQTIRYYEQAGLLNKALRGANNYRYYNQQHLAQLVFIRNCRHLDMTLEEIARLLTLRDQPIDDCQPINQLIDEHIEHVEARLNSLHKLKQELLELRQHCQTTSRSGDCGIVEQLQQTIHNEAGSPLHSHVGASHRH